MELPVSKIALGASRTDAYPAEERGFWKCKDTPENKQVLKDLLIPSSVTITKELIFPYFSIVPANFA